MSAKAGFSLRLCGFEKGEEKKQSTRSRADMFAVFIV